MPEQELVKQLLHNQERMMLRQDEIVNALSGVNTRLAVIETKADHTETQVEKLEEAVKSMDKRMEKAESKFAYAAGAISILAIAAAQVGIWFQSFIKGM